MKRWSAWILTLVLCLTPMLACAQPVTTEALLVQLLAKLAEQMEYPSFALALEAGEAMIDACFALDEQGIPDFTFGARSGSEEIRMDIDAAGLRYQNGAQRIAATIETMMRVLTEDEPGARMPADVREEDIQLLVQIVSELMNASMSAVSTETIEVSEAQQTELTQTAQEPVYRTRTTIDVNALLAALDAAIPSALERHADALNGLAMRNQELIHDILNGDLGEMREIAQNWPEGLLAGLLPEGKRALAVIEAQGGDWTLAGYYDGMEIARIARTPDRLNGAFGLGREYVFDSDDLKMLMQMLCRLPAYVSEEAFTWRFRQQDNALTAHLKLDSQRLIEDLTTGMTGVMQEYRMEIEHMIARYAPWMTLAGMQGAAQLSWEDIYRELSGNRQGIIDSYSGSLTWNVYRNPLLRQIFGMNMPKMEMDLYMQNRPGKGPEILWSFAAPCLNAELTVSGSSVSGAYNIISAGTNGAKHGYINGFAAESSAQLMIGHQTGGRTDMRLTIDAKQEDGGWTVLVHDIDGAEAARARILPNQMHLTSGTLTADIALSDTGWNLTVNDGKDTALAQWYAYDGTWRGRIYINGEELNGMFAEEHDGGQLRIAHRQKYAGRSNELTLRAGAQSLSLLAGSVYNGRLMTGVDLDMQWSDNLPRMNGLIRFRNGDLTAAYLPGQLDIAATDTKYKNEWKLRIADLTAKDTDGNETRVEMQSKRTAGEKQQFSEDGWTIRTQPGGRQWISQITSDDGEQLTLTLDFAASPKPQDLTGYIWLTEEQTRQILYEMMATPTPVPVTTPMPAG